MGGIVSATGRLPIVRAFAEFQQVPGQLPGTVYLIISSGFLRAGFLMREKRGQDSLMIN